MTTQEKTTATDRVKEDYIGNRFSTIEDLENGTYNLPVKSELRDLQNNLIGIKFGAPTPPIPPAKKTPLPKPLPLTWSDRRERWFKWDDIKQNLYHHISIAVILGVAAIGGTVEAQGATAAGTIGATVTAALAVSNLTNMNFGSFTTNGTAGNIKLNLDGSRVITGGGVLGNAAGVSIASFNLTGQPNAAVLVTPPTVVTLSDSNSHTMTVDTWVSGDGFDGAPFSLSAAGTATIHGGGYLHYGTLATTPPGNYSGNYNITANYP